MDNLQNEVFINPKKQEIKNFLTKSNYFKNIKNMDLFIEKLYEAYKTKDIIFELRKMELWLVSNPNRGKKNYSKFICNWIGKQGGRYKWIY